MMASEVNSCFWPRTEVKLNLYLDYDTLLNEKKPTVIVKTFYNSKCID